MSRTSFLLRFLKNPKQIGSVTPSSRWLCRRMLGYADLGHAKCVVEFGPGTACLTRMILNRLSPSASLVAFEVNYEFVHDLRKKIPHSGLLVVHDSAEKVETYLNAYGHSGADYIFSGLPFTTIPSKLRVRILRATNRALKNEGKFIAYQYSLYLLRLLRVIFGDVRVVFEPRNIPPAFCFICSKRITRKRRKVKR